MIAELEWRRLAGRLADQLYSEGFIRRPELREAFARTPRHVFVPQILSHRFDGAEQVVTAVGADDPEWLETVYSDAALVTQYKPLATRPEILMPTSSSTKPSLMADMIEELDIEPGMDVLESGTGTGYNAAVLSRYVGDSHVTTVDVDLELVEVAKARLADLGLQPAVTPKERSYDRILATHAVERIPRDWVRWARPGAQILVDVRSRNMTHVGAWAKLIVDDTGASAYGHLLPDRGAFMNARTGMERAEGHEQRLLTASDEIRDRPGDLPPDVLNDADFAFALWRQQPNLTWRSFESNGRLHANVSTEDGLWGDVTADSIAFTVQGDPWVLVEDAWRAWDSAKRPGIDAYSISVTPDGHTVLSVRTGG